MHRLFQYQYAITLARMTIVYSSRAGLFINNLKRTPKKFYIELRLQKARNLLVQTELKIIDIAVICGFVTAGHFSKVYKQHYKKSPSFERSAIQKLL